MTITSGSPVRFKFTDFKDNGDGRGDIPKVEMEHTKMNTDDEPDETDQAILRAAQEGIPVAG